VPCHGHVEPFRYDRRLITCVVLREGCDEQPHGKNTLGGDRHQESHGKGSAVHGLLFDRNRRRDARLAVRLRLGHRRSCKMAVGLNPLSGELNGFRYRAADHDPKSKVYFQRDGHRASPHF
jgi:hypothetical protein